MFDNYIVKHARSWYEFAGQRRGGIAPGSLYLITTCDKTDSWMVGVFGNGSGKTTFYMDIGAADCSYPWNGDGSGVIRTSPCHPTRSPSGRTNSPSEQSDSLPNVQNAQNQCIFIRGYTITARKSTTLQKAPTTSLSTAHRSGSGRRSDEEQPSQVPSFANSTSGASASDDEDDSSASEASVTLVYDGPADDVCGHIFRGDAELTCYIGLASSNGSESAFTGASDSYKFTQGLQ